MDKATYFQRLYSDVFSLNPADSGGIPSACVPYFEGHKPRFEAQVDMWNEFLDGERISRVLDLGTGVPFASYYFNATQGARVIFGMLDAALYRVNELVEAIKINLCTDRPDLGPADLVICTECLEHLPCNLYKVREYLKSLVAPGKFLLLSFPLMGAHACDYWMDGLGDPNVASSPHIREFTEATAREFYYGTGWDLVKEAITYTQAYGGNIMNVLLRRPA
jgi:hypothetical protein